MIARGSHPGTLASCFIGHAPRTSWVQQHGAEHRRNLCRRGEPTTMMVESQSTRRGTEDGLRAHHHCLEAQGKMSSGRLVLGVVAAALCAGALFGGAPAGYAIPEDASSPQAAELFVPGLEMNRALEQLSDSVIEWDQGKAIDQGIRGILSGVGDPYASLITKSPKTPKGPGPGADLRVRGRFDGLGLVLARPTRDAVARGIPDEVVVVGTSEAPGGSFERGVRTGDVILEVGGVATAGKTLQEVRELGLTGASSTGDEVELRLQRVVYGGVKEIDIVVSRSETKRETVQSGIVSVGGDQVAYIKIANFDQQTAQDFQNALGSLLLRDSVPKGLVLDLRDDGGGLIQSAVQVGSMLLPQGATIVRVESKTLPDVVYRSRGSPLTAELPPMAVLVNSRTASAAEILAGALQDSRAAAIVGPCATRGKALAQTVVPLNEEGSRLLSFSVASFKTPAGRVFAGKGLVPDLVSEADSSGPGVTAMIQQGLFFDWSSLWIQSHPDPLAALDADSKAALASLDKFAAEKVQEGSFSPGLLGDLAGQTLQLSDKLRRAGLQDGARAVDAVRASLDKQVLADASLHRPEELRMMRLAIQSRTSGDAAMAVFRADGDPAVKRAAKWLVEGGREGQRGRAAEWERPMPEERSGDVFERLYPDIDVIFM